MSIADVLVPNALVSGTYAPTWATTAGFTTPPTVVNINWQRLGNIVHCSFIAVDAGVSGVGVDTATVTLPVPRSAPFTGLPQECNGAAALYGASVGGGGYFTPTAGQQTATVNTQSGSPGIATLSGFFTYTV